MMDRRTALHWSKRNNEHPLPQQTADLRMANASLHAITAVWVLVAWVSQGSLSASIVSADEFPREIVDFIPYEMNPVFSGRGGEHWDAKIRERGMSESSTRGFGPSAPPVEDEPEAFYEPR